MKSLSAAALAAATAVLLLSGCAATPTAPTTSAAPEVSAADAYCVDKGGTIEMRQPTWGTNNPESEWVELGDPVKTCRFTSETDGNTTSIFVDPATLSSKKPTLAAIAYLAKKPLPDVAPANPAAQGCVDLGGARNYGPGVDGGGMVLKGDPLDVVAFCVFADGSFIDEWGIGYYSVDTVRGADLAPMFRFATSAAPKIFG